MSRVRFRDAAWLAKPPMNVTIAGVGGYGAYLAYLISQNIPAGSTLTLFDPDRVELHNVGNQFFSLPNVGSKKVSAVENRLEEFDTSTTINVITIAENATCEDDCDVFLIATDNMASRKELYDQWVSHYQEGKIFIDMRSAAQQFQMYVLTAPSSEYESTFFDDAEVSEGSCAFRQTPQTSMLAAAVTTQAFCNLLTGLPVPYQTNWYGSGLLLKKTLITNDPVEANSQEVL